MNKSKLLSVQNDLSIAVPYTNNYISEQNFPHGNGHRDFIEGYRKFWKVYRKLSKVT